MARASPARFASQTSNPPSTPASTLTPSRLDNVRIDVPVNKPQDRPVVREDAAMGQGHIHAISNTRGGRPIDSQSRTSSYSRGSDIQSPLSSEAQKPGEHFQEKHVITPGKSTTRYAGQNSRPPSVLVVGSTTLIMNLNLVQTTFVMPSATSLSSFTPAQKPAPPPRQWGWLQSIRDYTRNLPFIHY
jgi:hypothetical protein